MTLAYRDGQEVEAHGVVLVPSGYLFQKFLKLKKRSHLLFNNMVMKFSIWPVKIDSKFIAEEVLSTARKSRTEIHGNYI